MLRDRESKRMSRDLRRQDPDAVAISLAKVIERATTKGK
jgi:hypothetical protein